MIHNVDTTSVSNIPQENENTANLSGQLDGKSVTQAKHHLVVGGNSPKPDAAATGQSADKVSLVSASRTLAGTVKRSTVPKTNLQRLIQGLLRFLGCWSGPSRSSVSDPPQRNAAAQNAARTVAADRKTSVTPPERAARRSAKKLVALMLNHESSADQIKGQVRDLANETQSMATINQSTDHATSAKQQFAETVESVLTHVLAKDSHDKADHKIHSLNFVSGGSRGKIMDDLKSIKTSSGANSAFDAIVLDTAIRLMGGEEL
ncbi:hypothetical protein [Roseiconus lacunae]|uniref:hypothetical protein n=1 Tax=Roseiconus lacunae TaxID=2605694 RepID=UPI001E485C3D|nr:hypothetical protein [Roseiconus lacunae]MCD0457858.1 hypothetical protein [Roseiconus lacunae]